MRKTCKKVALVLICFLAIILLVGLQSCGHFWKPKPPLTPIPLEEIETIRAQGLLYSAKIRVLPMASSIYTKELEPLVQKIWFDPRYKQQAPKEASLIFRLYAATLLFTPLDNKGPLWPIKMALPWLSKSVELDKMSKPRFKDFLELESAQDFFISVVTDPKIPSQQLTFVSI